MNGVSDGEPTSGPLPAASGLRFAGFFFPLLQAMFGVSGQPAIREQGFQSGGVTWGDGLESDVAHRSSMATRPLRLGQSALAQPLPLGIHVAAAPGTEGRCNFGIRLRHDEVVQSALVVALPLASEIAAGLALAECAGGRLAAVPASEALGQHLGSP